MQLPEPSVLQQIGASLQDFALDRLWAWIAGLVAAAVIARRAQLRGFVGPALYLPLGAVIGIGGVVAVTAVLAWSRAVFYVAAGTGLFIGLLISAVRLHRSEQARLAKYPKGILDYRKDIAKAIKDFSAASGQLTAETNRIAARTKKEAAKFERAKTEAAQEAAVNITALKVRNGARRYRQRAETLRRSNQRLLDAMVGYVGVLDEAGNTAQANEQRQVLFVFRDAVRDNVSSILGWRESLVATPNMNQQLNASQAEMIESINVALEIMESSLAMLEKVQTS